MSTQRLPEDDQWIAAMLNDIGESPAGALTKILDSADLMGKLVELASSRRATYESTITKMQDAGLKKVDTGRIERAVKHEQQRYGGMRLVKLDESWQPATVLDALPDAPVPEVAVVPDGWRLTAEGIQRHDQEGAAHHVASGPMVITKRLTNVWDGSEWTELAHRRSGVWHRHITERNVIADTRSVVRLAGYGFPINSINGRDVVAYLSAYEALNFKTIPCPAVSDRMGWQPDGSFLVGAQHIKTPEPGGAVITFRSADSGEDQLAAALRTGGTLEGWLNVVQDVRECPRAMLSIYAALAAPLVEVLGAPNMIVDWCNPTSTGKTTVLRLGASCWGNPDERVPESIVGSWDATSVWIERAASMLNGLPLVLDETKRAKTPRNIAKALYEIANGRGRGRGSLEGTRRTGAWKLTLLSSGESPAVGVSGDGGAHARVLTVWGPPLGGVGEEHAVLANTIRIGVLEHFGHVGPLLVKHVLEHRHQWDEWRADYQRKEAAFTKRAGGNGVAARYASYFTLLEMTALLVHAALGEAAWELRSLAEDLWKDLIAGADEADRAREALEAAYSWAIANPRSFFNHASESGSDAPPSGWAGRWDRGEGDDWEYIGFLPARLGKVLEESGQDVDAVLRTWGDRGWLDIDGDRKRNQKKVRIDGRHVRVVAIRRDAVSEVIGEDQDGGNGGNKPQVGGNSQVVLQ